MSVTYTRNDYRGPLSWSLEQQKKYVEVEGEYLQQLPILLIQPANITLKSEPVSSELKTPPYVDFALDVAITSIV